MAKKGSRYRYQPVESKIWHDEKFCSLTDFSRMLFLYLLTSPSNNMIGLYVLQPGTAAEDLRIDLKRCPEWYANGFMNGCDDDYPTVHYTVQGTVPGTVQQTVSGTDFGWWEGLAELSMKGMISYDPVAKVVWLKRFLEYNIFANVNIAKAAVAALRDLPETLLLDAWLEVADGIKEGCANQVRDLYLYHYPAARKRLPKPLPVPLPKPYANRTVTQEQEQVQKQDQEQEPPTFKNPNVAMKENLCQKDERHNPFKSSTEFYGIGTAEELEADTTFQADHVAAYLEDVEAISAYQVDAG